MLIDSNVLVAILQDEGGSHRLYADKAVQAGGLVPSAVVAEVCNVMLSKARGVARVSGQPFGKVKERECNRDNAKAMLSLIDSTAVSCDETTKCALSTMAMSGLDFVDNLLYVQSLQSSESVATGDTDLSYFLGDKHWEP